jgi:hypothetical protein
VGSIPIRLQNANPESGIMQQKMATTVVSPSPTISLNNCSFSEALVGKRSDDVRNKKVLT